jgi:hypothetical protein
MKERRRKNWFKKRDGVFEFIYIHREREREQFSLLRVILKGETFYFWTRLFFAPVFFFFVFFFFFFTVLVCLLLVHPCSSHVTRTGGILCLYWPRLERLERSGPLSPPEKTIKREPRRRRRRRRSWLKEQLQTRTQLNSQSTHSEDVVRRR